VKNRFNIKVVDRRKPSTFVAIAHHLKNEGLFAILPDVRHNKQAVSVTVFGKPNVQLGKGVAKFARMANVPVIPFIMQRKDASHHSLTLGTPIFPNLDVSFEEDAQRILQTLWDLFEVRIREKPEQWFWHNRRWILTPQNVRTRK
jgi:KDO2-lipid IV(A) lauroyltransferase